MLGWAGLSVTAQDQLRFFLALRQNFGITHGVQTTTRIHVSTNTNVRLAC